MRMADSLILWGMSLTCQGEVLNCRDEACLVLLCQHGRHRIP